MFKYEYKKKKFILIFLLSQGKLEKNNKKSRKNININNGKVGCGRLL